MCRTAAAPSRSLTTEENLRLGAFARRDKAATGRRTTSGCTGYFPILTERRTQQAGTLSGGEQQMLAVSRALMLRPRLLLLDEPSFGLAPLIVKEIFAIMREINREQKVTILLVEQNAAMALDLADHAYLLETGRIVLSGSSRRDQAATTRCAAPTSAIRRKARMDAFLHQVIAGLATGGIYASLALALVMIYQATHHVNFAQGELAMFSTYLVLDPDQRRLALLGGVLRDRWSSPSCWAPRSSASSCARWSTRRCSRWWSCSSACW